MDKSKLKVDFCERQAAEYAVKHWHYSRAMPAGKLVCLGAWEESEFVGSVIFGRGATNHIGRPFGLIQTEVCELVRVAFRNHATPISKILALCVRFLKSHSPGLKLIVSYADPAYGHYGGIYQACGWLYVGQTKPDAYHRIGSKIMHRRSVVSRYGTASGSIRIVSSAKYKYLMPLNAETRERLLALSKLYPKRATSDPATRPAIQPEKGGAAPTVALKPNATHG